MCVCVYVRAYVPLERSVKTGQGRESGGGGNLQLESSSIMHNKETRDHTELGKGHKR